MNTTSIDRKAAAAAVAVATGIFVISAVANSLGTSSGAQDADEVDRPASELSVAQAMPGVCELDWNRDTATPGGEPVVNVVADGCDESASSDFVIHIPDELDRKGLNEQALTIELVGANAERFADELDDGVEYTIEVESNSVASWPTVDAEDLVTVERLDGSDSFVYFVYEDPESVND